MATKPHIPENGTGKRTPPTEPDSPRLSAMQQRFIDQQRIWREKALAALHHFQATIQMVDETSREADLFPYRTEELAEIKKDLIRTQMRLECMIMRPPSGDHLHSVSIIPSLPKLP